MVQKHLVENHRKWEGLIMRIMMDDGNCNGDRSDNNKDNHMIMIIVTILIIIIILIIIKSVILQYDNDDNGNRNQANTQLQKEVYPLGNQRRTSWCKTGGARVLWWQDS